MANAHRRRNFLKNISINGRRYEEEVELKEGLAGAFQNTLSNLGGCHPPLLELPFKEVARLEEMFTKTDVVVALSRLNGDKAPGPHGFPTTFWSFCLDFVKDEIMGFFKEFFFIRTSLSKASMPRF